MAGTRGFNTPNRFTHNDHFVVGEAVAFRAVAIPATRDDVVQRVATKRIDAVEPRSCWMQRLAAVVASLAQQLGVLLKGNVELVVSFLRRASQSAISTTCRGGVGPALVPSAGSTSQRAAKRLPGIALAKLAQRLAHAADAAHQRSFRSTLVANLLVFLKLGPALLLSAMKAGCRPRQASIAINLATAILAYGGYSGCGSGVFVKLADGLHCPAPTTSSDGAETLGANRGPGGEGRLDLIATMAPALPPMISVSTQSPHAIAAHPTQPTSRRAAVKPIKGQHLAAHGALPALAATFRAILRVAMEVDRRPTHSACLAGFSPGSSFRRSAFTACVGAPLRELSKWFYFPTHGATSVVRVTLAAQYRLVVLHCVRVQNHMTSSALSVVHGSSSPAKVVHTGPLLRAGQGNKSRRQTQ